MKLRTQLVLGFLLVLVFMVILAGLTYRSLAAVVENDAWVTHTLEVISKANLAQRLLIDMESEVS